eukprot:m.70339 g.70339  ORF g.70339 m.70339 type:complete len:321 (+) comp7587_c0_seq5:2-964(+)
MDYVAVAVSLAAFILAALALLARLRATQLSKPKESCCDRVLGADLDLGSSVIHAERARRLFREFFFSTVMDQYPTDSTRFSQLCDPVSRYFTMADAESFCARRFLAALCELQTTLSTISWRAGPIVGFALRYGERLAAGLRTQAVIIQRIQAAVTRLGITHEVGLGADRGNMLRCAVHDDLVMRFSVVLVIADVIVDPDGAFSRARISAQPQGSLNDIISQAHARLAALTGREDIGEHRHCQTSIDRPDDDGTGSGTDGSDFDPAIVDAGSNRQGISRSLSLATADPVSLARAAVSMIEAVVDCASTHMAVWEPRASIRA